MAITYFPFTPSINTPFQFQPQLDGATYSAVVTWNLFAQRYYVNLYALDGTLVFSVPVAGSVNWAPVQVETIYQSNFVRVCSPSGAGLDFLVSTQTPDDFFVTGDPLENAFIIVNQAASLPVTALVNGAQIISSLLPEGTTITVPGSPFVSVTVGALATGTDPNALLNNDVNLAKGYFTQQALVYRQAAVRFEVYDVAQPASLPGQSMFTAEGFPSGLVSPFPPTPPSSFNPGAVHFDGQTDLSGFPAMTDSPRGFISVWLNGSNIFNGQDNGWLLTTPGYPQIFGFIDQPGPGFGAFPNFFLWSFWDSLTNNSQYNWKSSTAMPGDGWVNLLLDWDMDNSGSQTFHMYFGETQVTPAVGWPQTFGPLPFSIAYSTPSDSLFLPSHAPAGWAWGMSMTVDMAEAVFAPGQTMDFSVAINRHKFHDPSTGRPVFLGVHGELPTGVAPTLYLHIGAGDANAGDFANNSSGLGALTVDGDALTIASTNPMTGPLG